MAFTAGQKGYAAGSPVLSKPPPTAAPAAPCARLEGAMTNVFANGLEISGKAVAQRHRGLPRHLLYPAQTPATPPGVPVPYPSFGMDSDTDKGTGTVIIGGETVNIKNKSDLSKTSGTEAGCAAKKGIVTSKNTGKGYLSLGPTT